MASSQDTEWSTDWTTSGIWMLNNSLLNRGDSWIMHQPAECPISFCPLQAMLLHSDLSREQKVSAQTLGTPSTSIRQSCPPQPCNSGAHNGTGAERREKELTFTAMIIFLLGFYRFFWAFLYTTQSCACWDGRKSCNLTTLCCFSIIQVMETSYFTWQIS